MTKVTVSKKETWSNGLDFFFSCIGFAVGVGNVWRFAFLCYRNGGGAYLIPYFTSMFVLVMPMIYLEFIIGQFTSDGVLTAFRMVKITSGIGLSINLVNALCLPFFSMIITYALHYLSLSFNAELPWQNCIHGWSSPNCVDDFSPDKFTFNECLDTGTLLKCSQKDSINFGRCFNKTAIDGSLASCSSNQTDLKQVGFWKTSFPSADYWKYSVLEQSDSIEETGGFVWHLLYKFLVVYVIAYIILIRGIKVSGKAIYVTTIFPYVVLIVLGVRGFMLPGAAIGIKFYLTPRWEYLYNIQTWSEATCAVFWSCGVSFGGMLTLSSYNKFDSNIRRMAIALPIINCLTSFFAGFVVFAYMGYLSHITGQNIDNIIEAGQGLAFVVYPYAVTTMVGSSTWSILFFIMLVLLGISSMTNYIQITITSVLDGFPACNKTSSRRYLTITGIFIIYVIAGLIFNFQSGTYWMEFFNNYAAGWVVLVIGAMECLIVSVLYGPANMRNDIEAMLGTAYTKATSYNVWVAAMFICPTICFGLTILALSKADNLKVADYTFPDWCFFAGQFMQLSIIGAMFFVGIYYIIRAKYDGNQTVTSLFKPNFDSYLPKLESNRIKVQLMRRNLKSYLSIKEKPLYERELLSNKSLISKETV